MNSDIKNAIPRGAEFHEGIARNWALGYVRASFKHRLELFNSIFDRLVLPNELWLDLGCGSGVLTSELIRRGARVVALDGSPSMLAEARRTLAAATNEQVTFRQGDVQDLSWSAPSVFDGVLCSSVVEYVDYPDALIRQVSYVLKDNGLLIVSIPPTKSLVRSVQKALRHIFKWIRKNRYAYLEVSRYEIDPPAVKEWLAQGNIRIERITEYDPFLPKCMLRVCRPALLICEAKRLPSY